MTINNKKDSSLIAIHEISEDRINYKEEHYKEILSAAQPYLSDKEISESYRQAMSALKDKGKLNFKGENK